MNLDIQFLARHWLFVNNVCYFVKSIFCILYSVLCSSYQGFFFNPFVLGWMDDNFLYLKLSSHSVDSKSTKSTKSRNPLLYTNPAAVVPSIEKPRDTRNCICCKTLTLAWQSECTFMYISCCGVNYCHISSLILWV